MTPALLEVLEYIEGRQGKMECCKEVGKGYSKD